MCLKVFSSEKNIKKLGFLKLKNSDPNFSVTQDNRTTNQLATSHLHKNSEGPPSPPDFFFLNCILTLLSYVIIVLLVYSYEQYVIFFLSSSFFWQI